MADDQGGQLGGSSRGKAIITWIVAPMVVIAFFPFLVLLLVGMAPTLVAYVIDKRPRKVTARAIGYLNFAGCMPYLFTLASGQSTISNALSLVADPSALMIMYSAAAAGWMLNFLMSPVMTAWLAVQHESRGRSIRNRQDELIKEWGSEVKGQYTPAVAAPQSAPEAAGGEPEAEAGYAAADDGDGDPESDETR